jgi:Cu/Ag efflux pump CusA
VPGSEILQPVAVVILGGLVTVTILDQLFTPALFYALGSRTIRDKESPAEAVTSPS